MVAEGALGIPNLYHYYKAAILSTMLAAHDPHYTPQWAVIEAFWLNIDHIHHTFWTDSTRRPRPFQGLPTTRLLLDTWDRVRNTLVTHPRIPMAAPLQSISLMIPTFNHKPWTDKGVTHVLHLYNGGHLKSFTSLQEQSDLPAKLLFPYLQVKSLLTNNPPINPEKGTQALTSKFENMCLSNKPNAKSLSTCYHLILHNQPLTQEHYQKAWHADLGIELSPEQWKRAYTAHRGLTSCAQHLEL
ncbi:Hypothetical predicted protein [Pelobates cultripes]|uniref:Uncharacterized protein n=1 Tax=Pelobates cultripes TaxID=61616 RepID=A0AAD1VUE6_PELCU|nr:Hypothetical predicted protein [Pelobates cultripes]